MKQILIVDHFDWTQTEDDFVDGEVGLTEYVYDESGLGVFTDFGSLVKKMGQYGVPDDPDAWSVFPGDHDGARIDVQFQTLADATTPTEADVKAWKAGTTKLFTAYVSIHVRIADNVRVPTGDELEAFTGLRVS